MVDQARDPGAGRGAAVRQRFRATEAPAGASEGNGADLKNLDDMR